jgi:hypothetical protein
MSGSPYKNLDSSSSSESDTDITNKRSYYYDPDFKPPKPNPESEAGPSHRVLRPRTKQVPLSHKTYGLGFSGASSDSEEQDKVLEGLRDIRKSLEFKTPSSSEHSDSELTDSDAESHSDHSDENLLNNEEESDSDLEISQEQFDFIARIMANNEGGGVPIVGEGLGDEDQVAAAAAAAAAEAAAAHQQQPPYQQRQPTFGISNIFTDVGKFDGSGHFNSWLNDFVETCTIYGFDTVERRHNLLRKSLIGDARKWRDVYEAGHPNADAQQFLAALTEAHQGTDRQRQKKALSAFNKATKLPSEKYVNFANRLQFLALDMNPRPTAEVMIDRCIEGCPPDAKERLIAVRPLTMEDLNTQLAIQDEIAQGRQQTYVQSVQNYAAQLDLKKGFEKEICPQI